MTFFPPLPARPSLPLGEEAFCAYLNGKDLDPALPRAERRRIIRPAAGLRSSTATAEQGAPHNGRRFPPLLFSG